MPELPEVQTTVNGLNAKVKGLTIKEVWTDYNSKFHRGKDSIKDPSYFARFKREVEGAKIAHASRIGKNVLLHIKKGLHRAVILIHMKMTGHIMVGRYIHDPKKDAWTPAPDERDSLRDPYNRFVHFVIALSNRQHLALSDTRKFAKVTLIPEDELENTAHLSHIGPDPLDEDFTFGLFKERILRRPTGRIKTVLMDPSVIAGVGNIYSDEALWRAGLHPETRAEKIPDACLEDLHKALLAVLSKGIDFGGDSMSDYRNIDGERGRFQEHHKVYQRRGERCSKPGCKGTIVRKVIGGRSAHFCDAHQKLFR